MKFHDSTKGRGQLTIEFEDTDSEQTKELARIQWNAIRSLITALQSRGA